MRLVVDLTRCQGYAQCAFLAPDVFTMHGDEALMYDPAPDNAQRKRLLRATAACPVQAIQLDLVDGQAGSLTADASSKTGSPKTGSPKRTVSGGGDATGETFKRTGRIVIVGASLAGLRAAERLREEGFTGSLTVVGDEPHKPYDRPPLSKQVQTGWVAAPRTPLPRRRDVGADWRLGVAATGLDLAARQVRLADGTQIGFDRLLIATGVRARQWPIPAEAALAGVQVLRTREDAAQLQQLIAAGPRRVLVIGAGFTGSEIASVCRQLDLPVTVAEAGPAPLGAALGGVVGAIEADVHRENGVDLRCGIMVTALEGDASGRLRRAHLSDGSTLDVDVAVVALGGIRNVDWLADSGLACGIWGVACDAGCRAFDANGLVTDDVFVAGDVARAPQPMFGYQLLALEHWGNAVSQAEVAAHNMISSETYRWPYLAVPKFWSIQFGHEIKSVGVPPFADEVVIAQGSVPERRFVAVYGRQGRIVAAVAFDQNKWVDFYEPLIEQAAPFPPAFHHVDEPARMQPVPAEFGAQISPTQDATVVVTGHEPSERRARLLPRGSRGRLDGAPSHIGATLPTRERTSQGAVVMAQPTLWEQILDHSHRADPYPLYAELRKTPVTRQADGSYLVSTYPEISSLLHDPRISSDLSNAAGTVAADSGEMPGPPSFLHMDPPDHDRLRRMTNRHFGPPDTPGRIAGMEPDLLRIVTELIDVCAERVRIDVVDDLAYPFPVAVICELLGVPREDEPRFRAWVEEAMKSFDPELDPAAQQRSSAQARADLRRYLADLAEAHRQAPGDDLLSALATDDGPEGRMPTEQLASIAGLLLVAGHETTVNLIANGTLTLLRHPDVLQRLRHDPDLAIPMVEELLRYEPPVHFLPWRTTLDDIEIAGTTIPRGAPVTLVLAAGSRDPDHVPDPDRFVPDRQNNEHLGFGGGVHLCFGAPLARLEAQIALTEVARRLQNPRLVTDPPPYRPNPVLRGPLHLLIDVDGVAPGPAAAGVILPRAREEQAAEPARPPARRP